jgi:hypothetical protein
MATLIRPSIDREIILEWCGFRARAIELVYAGWDIFVEDEPFRRCVIINLKHREHDIRATGYMSEIDWHHAYPEHVVYAKIKLQTGRAVNIKYYGEGPRTLIPAAVASVGYREIRYYEPKEENPTDIITDKLTVLEMLEAIQKKQKPKQQEILRKRMRDQKLENMKVQARIIEVS